MLLQVNGHGPTTTQSEKNEEAEPMYNANNSGVTVGHQHVHEEVPIELLGGTNDPDQQFQVK